jgi:hypothetical protein
MPPLPTDAIGQDPSGAPEKDRGACPKCRIVAAPLPSTGLPGPLEHVVVTSADRDDLADAGAEKNRYQGAQYDWTPTRVKGNGR